MSESKGQHEPSMEEILASIRRIIAEDGDQTAPAAAPAAPAAAPAPPPPPAARAEEILELTEVVEEEHAAPEPPAAPELVLPPEVPPPPAPEPPPVDSGDRLVSDETAAASVAALSQLNQLGGRSEQRMSDIPLGQGQRSIEDLVREMLRPLLKEWLDSNLPHIVERVVQEEVGRLVREVQKR